MSPTSNEGKFAEVGNSAQPPVELFPGEVVLWRGQPKRGIVFTGFDIGFVPFSFLWFGFSLFAAFNVRGARPFAFSLIPLLFCAIGFYMAIGRFIADAWYRSRLDYIVTNQRMVIISRWFGHSVQSTSRSPATTLRLTEHRDGTGTISTDPDPWSFLYTNGWHACLGRAPMLFRIPEAPRVHKLLLSEVA